MAEKEGWPPMVFPYTQDSNERIMYMHKVDEGIIFAPVKRGAMGIPENLVVGFINDLEEEHPDKQFSWFSMGRFLELPEEG